MNTPTPLSSDQCKIWWNIANVGGGGTDWLMTSNSMPMCSCSYSRKSWLLSWIDVACGEILWRMAWTEVLVGILVAPAAASRLPRHQPSSAHPTMVTRHVCQAYCAYTPGLLCLQTMPTLPTIPTVLTMPTHQAYHTKHRATMFTMSVKPQVLLGLSMKW